MVKFLVYGMHRNLLCLERGQLSLQNLQGKLNSNISSPLSLLSRNLLMNMFVM